MHLDRITVPDAPPQRTREPQRPCFCDTIGSSIAGALFVLSLVAFAFSESATAQNYSLEERLNKTYKLGIAPADKGTPLGKYMETVNGISAQCSKLNILVDKVCCQVHGIGCNVQYICENISIDQVDLMAEAYRHSFNGNPVYAIHHGSVLRDLSRYFGALQLYGRSRGMLPIGYTRHRIVVDDEETKNSARKIDPNNLDFYFLGTIVPGLSAKKGRQLMLNYYASQQGLLLSVSPTVETSLAQAVSEYRANLFSFEEKQFTGTGAHDLFDLSNGELIPSIAGCMALCENEPSYYRFLLSTNDKSKR